MITTTSLVPLVFGGIMQVSCLLETKTTFVQLFSLIITVGGLVIGVGFILIVFVTNKTRQTQPTTVVD